MINIKSIFLLVGAIVTLFGCGPDSGESNGPESANAVVQIPVEERRIAIVHSNSTKLNYYDPFAYNQLFASVQFQAVMAGLPFDLLSEEELTVADLSAYDAVLLPLFSHVKAENREPVRNALLAAQQAGTGIVTSGEFMGLKDDGEAYTDYSRMMEEVLGVQPVEFLSAVASLVTVSNNQHPATSDYSVGEQLVAYDELWFAHYEPLDSEQSTVLTTVSASDTDYTGAQIIDRVGKVVHFANEQVMADNNLLWSVLQWIVYGDLPPVTLQLSRNESIFIGRNDMDLAMFPGELPGVHIPLLDLVRDWKQDYDFVSSYYIDIGNDPATGQFTDWTVSTPLYTEYMALGNEFGTHSWTHPHYVSTLTEEQIEFEFNQSKAEISTQLGVPVTGGAVPGNPEPLAVVEQLNQWFDYFSGRSGEVGIGYPNAFGFLEPQHDMFYFSLNMTADFELIDVLNKTPAQSLDIWRSQIDQLSVHSPQPVFHWLWHDYGPTKQTDAGFYSKEMFEQTIAYAQSLGTEFTTLSNLNERMRTFGNTRLSVGADSAIEANVDTVGVGQFALKLGAGNTIRSVANWYAYDDDQVFLADEGGNYQISIGPTADPVTRISKLPMRARLLTVTGDGDEIDFSFNGQGELTVVLSADMVGNATVTGADSFTEEDGELTLTFENDVTHTVTVTPTTPINQAPVALPLTLQTQTAQPLDILLSGSDSDGDALTYALQTEPLNGTLSGEAPALVYRSNLGFSGADSFSYAVSDGALDSTAVQVDIVVEVPRPANSTPLANRQVLASLVDQPLNILLSGSDNDNESLSYSITSQPQNGTVTGQPPNLVYTPDSGFTGVDELMFVANDGNSNSMPVSVVINVEPQLGASGGTLSNVLANVTLDGAFDDWSNAASFGVDPDDVTGANNPINWRQAWMGHDDSRYFIAYQNYNPVSLSWGYSVYMDSDTDDTTGFRGFSNSFTIGADYLLEGDSLFRYTSIDQNLWAWEFIGSVDAIVSEDRVELSFARTLIGNTDNLRLFFQGDNAAHNGTSLDRFPDDVTNDQAVLKNRRFSYSVNPNINTENTAPVANRQIINTTNNATLSVVLTGSDVNADTLVFEVVDFPLNGSLTGSAPNVQYSPDLDYTGIDSFTFRVFDGAIYSNLATVTFNVVSPPGVNGLPVADGQLVVTESGVPVNIVLSGSDSDGSSLTYTVVTPPVSGTLNGTAPNLVYLADANYTGEDSFSFRVNDGNDDSAEAVVNITVNQGQSANSPPVANGQNLGTAFNTALGLLLTGSDVDNDVLTYSIATPPTLGTLQGDAPQLTYVPDMGASGIDSFTVTVSDGQLVSAPAVISIEILAQVPVNRAPTANGQTLTVDAGQSIAIELTGSDPEATPLEFRLLSQPVGGTLNGTPPDLVYTPTGTYSGLDSFRFVVNDGELDSVDANVTIDVAQQPGGAVSNPVSSITIDGGLSDWAGVASFGLDPDDVTGPDNPLDWREVWIAHNQDNLFLAYRNDQAFQLSWGHGFYIDIDGNPNTGFRGFQNEFPIGADYLIESDDIQKYTGTGTNWSWDLVGSAVTKVSADVGELAIPRVLLGNPDTMQFYLRADNEPFGGIGIDHYPDAALDSAAAPESRALFYSTAP